MFAHDQEYIAYNSAYSSYILLIREYSFETKANKRVKEIIAIEV